MSCIWKKLSGSCLLKDLERACRLSYSSIQGMKLAGRRSINACSLRGCSISFFQFFSTNEAPRENLNACTELSPSFQPNSTRDFLTTCMTPLLCWTNTEQSIIKHSPSETGVLLHIWSQNVLVHAQKDGGRNPQPSVFLSSTRQVGRPCWWNASLDIGPLSQICCKQHFERIKGSLTISAWFLLFCFLWFRVMRHQLAADSLRIQLLL